jgi:hypothetical protein
VVLLTATKMAGTRTRSAAIRRRRGGPASTRRSTRPHLRADGHDDRRLGRDHGRPARLGAGDGGLGLELDAIIAVVIGGTRLSGGEGSVGRTALGVVFLSILNSGL